MTEGITRIMRTMRAQTMRGGLPSRGHPRPLEGNPCALRANPCAMRGNSCALRADLCALRGNPCALRSNPCSMRGNLCAWMVNYFLSCSEGNVKKATFQKVTFTEVYPQVSLGRALCTLRRLRALSTVADLEKNRNSGT